MGNWSKDGFVVQTKTKSALMQAVENLKLETRQKIYALASRGTVFQRGTWNGCVFNAITGGSQGVWAVANLLDENPNAVTNFITKWDALTLESGWMATRYLMKLIENVGVVKESPPKDPSKIVRKRIYTSEETLAVEAFRKEIDSGVFDDFLQEAESLVLA